MREIPNDEESFMTIKVGDRLPDATFKVRQDGDMIDVSVAELTKGKKVVLFAVPGAFTPTCHAKHVPSYLQHYDALKAKGVDTIACVAVNDPFVLAEWAKTQHSDGKVMMLSDGNAEFTKAIGLDFDGSGFKLGTRSKRYAMVVEDGVVKTLAVEEAPPMMEVSGAEHILQAL
jgi:glutaredoxin/glutathione-dependent peroxiredoxin